MKQVKLGGEKFDFQVRTKAPYDTSISYDLILEKLEVDSGKTALKNNEVKVYIEDFQGNVVLAPTKLSELNNYKLVSKTNNHSSTNKEIINKYRLRVWLDKDVDIFDNQNKQIKFRININKYPEKTDQNQIVLTYDSNGGEGCTKTTVTYNEAYGSLCTPTRENYDFLGWYTAKDGGTKVTSTTKATYDHIYAHWKANSAKVDVVVKNGIVVGNSTKYVNFNENVTFNLKPDVNGAEATVTCTNGQTASVTNNVLNVTNVSYNTICTVTYSSMQTVLYTDGTLIINEKESDRVANITTHGEVIKEYEAMSDSNAYVFSSSSSVLWYDNSSSIKSIIIGNNIKPTSTAYWACRLYMLETGDFSKLDTSQTIDMNSMFKESGWNSTFQLTGLNNWDTSSVKNMSYMFEGHGQEGASTWTIGDLSSWDTSSVTDMSFMFSHAGQYSRTWTIGDLSGWDTSSVTDMSYMFSHAGYMSSTTWSIGNISSWDTSSVTDMSYMFRWTARSATTFNIGDLSGWDTSSVTDMSYMFLCAGDEASTFNIGDLSGWNTSSVTNMSWMFAAAGESATWSLDCSGWNVNLVTSYTNFNYGVTSKVTAPTWVN